MTPSEKDYRELRSLLGFASDGHLTAEQQRRINDLLERFPDLQQYYVEFTLLNVELYGYRHLSQQEHSDLLTEQIVGPAVDEAAGSEIAEDPRVEEIRREAQRRLDAFLAEQEALRRKQIVQRRREDTLSLGQWIVLGADRLTRSLTWTAKATVRVAVILAVVLVGLAVTRHLLNQRVVATLEEQLYAQWDRPPEDADLHPGPLTLEQGFAKITLKQGAQILLQAPCAFDLRSGNRMHLKTGMVTAQVPPQAHGFSIRTPQSTVTDFGTEFGVQVKNLSESEVHVFDGCVQCRTARRKGKPSTTLDITRNRAGVLAASGDLTLEPLGARPNLFVRDLPDVNSQFGIPNKRLDLTDIVGGGNGFGTGQRLHCIDPATGETRLQYSYGRRERGEDYATVPQLPMVDGVFVPPGSGGFAPISSTGYHFEFPPTAGGGWWVEVAHATVANLEAANPVSLKLGEKTFGSGGHPALLMHANVGITFDLDAIRKTLGGTQIRSFTAYCGVSNRSRETGDPITEFCVLLDGQVKYRREIAMRTVPIPRLQVRVNKDHRFLTLVCLAGEQNHGDWSFFGEPALELERVEE